MLDRPADLARQLAAQRRYRARQRNGEGIAPVIYTAEIIEFLIETRWLTEREAGDRCNRQGHVGGVRGVGEVSLSPVMRFSAWAWVGSLPTCDHHHPTRDARSTTRLMPTAAPSPALSFVDDCHGSGSAEQMFGEKQQIPPAEQSD